jgi:alpha-glucosidase
MPQVLSYLGDFVDVVDRWAVSARDILGQTSLRTVAGIFGLVSSATSHAGSTSSLGCAGYAVKHVASTATSLTATLQLAKPCNVYGPDISDLKLLVEYQTGE